MAELPYPEPPPGEDLTTASALASTSSLFLPPAIPYPSPASANPISTIDSFDWRNGAPEEDLEVRDEDEEDEEEEYELGDTEEESDEEEEEEDPDSHPLYLLLSTSNLPKLREYWDASSLVLVPPRRTLPSLAPLSSPSPRPSTPPTRTPSSSSAGGGGFEFVRGGKGVQGELAGRSGVKERERKEALEKFVGLHAFKVDKEGEWWSSTASTGLRYLRARLELARGLVHLEWVEETEPIVVAKTRSLVASNSKTSIDSTTAETSHLDISPPSIPNQLPPPISMPIPFPSSSNPPLPSSPPPPPTTIRSLQVVTETTVYRRPRALSPLPSPVPSLKPPIPPKPAFRTPKWLRRGSTSQTPKTYSPELPREKAPMLERVRVIAVDGVVVSGEEMMGLGLGGGMLGRLGSGRKSRDDILVLGEKVERPGSIFAASGGGGSWVSSGSGFGVGGTGVPSKREFITDLTFLVSPPQHLVEVAPALHSALVVIKFLVNEFKTNFALIQGFDSYAVQRIRKGILDKAWLQLSRELSGSELGAMVVQEERGNLPQLVENVVMGLLHTKIYTTSLLPLFHSENAAINHILSLYRSLEVTPSHLGVDVCDLGNGELLQGAVSKMSRLGSTPISLITIPPELIEALTDDSLSAEGAKLLLEEARTPLDVVGVMKTAMEDIIATVEGTMVGLRVAPDDLIPLLSWVIVRSGAGDFESCLYYVKLYRNDNLQAEFDWALVTFRAAIAFLLSDPLRILPSSPPTTPLEHHHPALLNRRASDLPSFRHRNSSMHNLCSHSSLDSHSPPSSPRSLRAINTTGTTNTRSHPFLISPVLERRRPITLALDTDLDPAAFDVKGLLTPRGRPERPARSPSSEEMPPPTWTQPAGRERRQSLGILPSAAKKSLDASIASGAVRESTSKERPRLLSSSLSAATDLQIRPRIVLPHSSSGIRSHWQPTLRPTPRTVIGRTHSTISTRQIGPTDMRRSGSEGMPSPLLAKRGLNDSPWSSTFWRSDSPASSERGVSPARSDLTNGSERRPSLPDDHGSWWWGRERMPHSATTSIAASSDEGGSSGGAGIRARRHSASSADILGGFFGNNSSASEPPPASSARLAAVLASRHHHHSQHARPSSIISVSSIASSLELDTGSISGGGSGTSPASRPSLHAVRRNTKSLMMRDSASGSLERSQPLAPRLDSSISVITFAGADSGKGLQRIPSLPVPRTPVEIISPGFQRYQTDY